MKIEDVKAHILRPNSLDELIPLEIREEFARIGTELVFFGVPIEETGRFIIRVIDTYEKYREMKNK